MADPEHEHDEKLPRKATSEGPGAGPAPANPVHEGEAWDEVDEAVWESFPASDPPARWAGSDHAPEGEDAGSR